MHAYACERTLRSRTLEFHFLGSKASLFDRLWPINPLEHPKPSK